MEYLSKFTYVLFTTISLSFYVRFETFNSVTILCSALPDSI